MKKTLFAGLLLVAALPASAQTFTSSEAIAIPNSGNGAPYPSVIAVSGLSGNVTGLTVTLSGFTHTFPDDVDVLLVSPSGTPVVLMSDVGGSGDVAALNLVLQDGSPAMPDNGPLVSGTFAPTNIGATDTFPAPAPSTTPAANLAAYNGPASAANGNWSLYVVDDLTGDSGSFSGWSLTFTTAAGAPTTVAVGNASASEGNTGTVNLNFPITISPAAPAQIDLSFTTTAGSATSGVDYVAATNQALIVPIGATSATATVAVNGDLTVETLETLVLTIATATPNVTIVTNQALGEIIDNDTAVLSIANRAQPEGNSGTSPMAFTATLSNPVQGALSFNVSTANGTATAGSDYVALSNQTINVASGATTQTVNVTINGDTVLENDETFTLSMSNLVVPVGIGANAITLSPASITGTIQNDDTVGLSVADLSQAEGSFGNNSTFTVQVSLVGQSAIPVAVNFATANGTALAPSDYIATSGTLNFAPGVTSQTIPVTVNADQEAEPDETFLVNLTNPTPNPGATLTRPQATITILNDDYAAIIPTLNAWMLGALALVLGLIGMAAVRRFD